MECVTSYKQSLKSGVGLVTTHALLHPPLLSEKHALVLPFVYHFFERTQTQRDSNPLKQLNQLEL